jgi:Zn-dependent protease
MKDTVRLGRVGGVRVGLNWSLLAMVALVATGLAQNRFPFEAGGYSGRAYALAGAVTAIGLLVGVLLHEFGHAFMARRAGLNVDGITLGWMGGITRIEGEAPSPRDEMLIAGIGPLVSLLVGGAVWLARMAAASVGVGHLALAAMSWLAAINLVLAVFNMLPAAPLDGGKVLHSAVWGVTRNRWQATRVATSVGILLGAAMVAGGFFVAANRRNLVDGLFIGLIGWWLVGSARAELTVGALHRALDGVSVAQVMRPVGAAPGWITVRSFAEQYAARRPGCVWLLENWGGGGYGGVLLGEALNSVPFSQWDLLRPVDVALPITVTTGAQPDEQVLEALARTADKQIIIVVDGGRTVGAVLPSDLEALAKLAGRAQIVPGRPPAPRNVP